MHPFLPQQTLFRAYDIRGDYRYFTDDFVAGLADALSNHFSQFSINHKTQIVLGYDMRQGSLDIAKILASNFTKANIDVIWLGLITTPIMAYWAEQYQGHGIIVTASHSVKNYTGIKWLTAGKSPSSADITALYNSLYNSKAYVPSSPSLNQLWVGCQSKIINKQDVAITKYTQALHQAVKPLQTIKPNKMIRTLVIDCLNGTTSNVVYHVFSQYAQQVIVLNDNPDGNFPLGNPDPCENGRLQQLQSEVLKHNATLGLAFDGDGDRMMIVDSQGKIIDADNLLYLLANTAIEDQRLLKTTHNTQDATANMDVIFDVKCSHHLPVMLKKLGANPVMSKTGSSNMRQQMQLKNSTTLFAGELSGHFIFNDGLFISHDDGIYAGVRLLHWLAKQPHTLHHIINQLPSMVSTTDVYIPVQKEQQSLLAKLITMIKNWLNDLGTAIANNTTPAIKLPKDAKVCLIDGIRLDFKNGFGVIRSSNTSQSFTIRFAGNTMADIQKIQQQLVALCRQIDDKLANQVAKIQPI
ncbi:MAG: phosphomannomutase/phosphoglucomutase [Gammaproteobacteria bacterium]|nr:MAG: phosphomannomutase/phosphoglucomutase [Gammaproteobacteria bacterium]